MAEEFLRSMARLTVFVICAQMLVYFRPKQVYEKYLRLLMNLLILLQLLLPVGNFLRGGTAQDLQARYEDFQNRLEEYMEGTARRTYESWGAEESEGEGVLLGGYPESADPWNKGEDLLKEGETLNEEPGENNAAGQNGPEVSGGIGAVERVEIPPVEVGGDDER